MREIRRRRPTGTGRRSGALRAGRVTASALRAGRVTAVALATVALSAACAISSDKPSDSQVGPSDTTSAGSESAPPSDAGCGDVLDDAASGIQDHVGPGTSSPEITRVEYDTNPPSHGAHYAEPAALERHFYTSVDAPAVEQLVHNLEHGYTVVWYDSSVSEDDVAALKTIASRIADKTPKFIVTAWDESRGGLPEGHIALTHWGLDAGHRQYCDTVGNDAIKAFVKQFPYTDSPEPNAG